jgi:pyruvate/2-oxoglutarate dehydrogenase complex dihydrolipoamide acyltransferase (E2) component
MVEMRMPKLGMDMTSGKVLKWLVPPGSRVTKGESIAEIETDKVTVCLEAPESGLLREVVAPAGTIVEAGQTLAVIET